MHRTLTLLCLSLLTGTTAAQTTPPELHTPWGHPDLQGTWSYATVTPLQRPAALGDKTHYTPEEAEQARLRAEAESADIPGDPIGWYDKGDVTPDLRTSLIIDPPDGRLPLTDFARQQQAELNAWREAHLAASWLDRTAWDRCITYHGVPPVSTGYNNAFMIVQTPDTVAIYSETIHDVRIIPLDGRPQLDSRIPQWNGSSRGRWEGDTLVVETTNYSAKTELRFPSSANTRAIERFTRVSEDLMDYSFTIEDPQIYTRPWTAERPMPRLTDYIIYEYACHEGNRSLYNLLRGARIQEERERAAP